MGNNKMKRYYLNILLTIVMVFGMLLVQKINAMADTDYNPFGELTNMSISNQSGQGITTQNVYCLESSVIVLEADVYTGGAIYIPYGNEVTIDLNGHNIDRGLTDSEPVSDGYVILNAGTLTIKDSTAPWDVAYEEYADEITYDSGKITGGNNKTEQGNLTSTDDTAGGIFNIGTLIMESGTISGNKAVGYGGGVVSYHYTNDPAVSFTFTGGMITNNTAKQGGAAYFRNGNNTVIMEHGLIANNESTGNGGAIGMMYGDFIMKGGIIRDNIAQKNGGAIYHQAGGIRGQSETKIDGGRILFNRAETGSGGGIYSLNCGIPLELKSGKISENFSAKDGGGVYIDKNRGCNITGDIEISENVALENGGGLSIASDVNCPFSWNGEARIINNKASGNGGGVYIRGATKSRNKGTCTMSGGTISGNTASGDGGGVFFSTNSFYDFKVSGKVLIENNKKDETTISNVKLGNNNPIIVENNLDEDTSIGVTTLSVPVTITSGLGSYGGASNFTSDEGYEVFLVNSEVMIGCEHNYSFSAVADTITAICNKGKCTLADNKTTLTIVKPAHSAINDGLSAEATFTGDTSIQGDATVSYYKATKGVEGYVRSGESLDSPPLDVGDYTAEITIGEGDNSATAVVGYTIAPIELTEGQKPTAQSGIIYTGEPQELITAPAEDLPEGYTIQYSLDGTNWSTNIPVAIQTGQHIVNVKYIGSGEHLSFNGDNIIVTIAKASQDAPNAPVEAIIGSTYVTLTAIDGYEYSKDGTVWQSSPTFTGLNIDTEYTFYQRIAESENYNASLSSDGTVIKTLNHTHEWSYATEGAVITATCADTDGGHGTTKTATLTVVEPTLTTYGETGDGISPNATITGSVEGVTNPSIVYKKGDEVLSEAPTDAGTYTASITLSDVALTEGGTGDVTASVEYTIAKADPGTPTVAMSGYTYKGTVSTPTIPATYIGDGTPTFYYSATDTNTGGTEWSGITNTTLDAGTYYMYAVISDGENYKGCTTGTTEFVVSKADRETPAAPTANSVSVNSITLASIEGGMYKCGDGEWQASPTFSGLEMNKEYTFYQKIAETTNYNESASSPAATISTANHVHEWSYATEGAVITATCADTDGGHGTTKTATLTVVEPTLTTYGETGDGISSNATITGSIEGVTNPAIVYKKGDEVLSEAPTDAGTYTASITLSNVALTEGGTGDVTASVEYTIAKADPGTPTVTMGGYTYGNDASTPSISDYIGGGAVSYYYNTANSNTGGTAWSATNPPSLLAGTYYMYAVVTGTDNYNGYITATDEFVVAQRPVTVSGITADNKEYDGTTSATLKYGDVTFNNKVSDDKLSVTATGTFENANAGENKTVNISGITLGGEDVANYVLAASGQQETATANISAKSIASATVTLDNTSFVYDSTTKTVSVTSVKLGDTILSSNVDYEVKADSSTTSATDADNYTVTVIGKGNYTGSASASWTISEKTMTASAEDVEAVYNGSSHEINVVLTDPAIGYTVSYGLEEGTYSSAHPEIINAGTTTVYYKVTADNYVDYTGSATVTISPKEVTITGLSVSNKTYDGTVAATITGTAVIDGKVEGDDVSVVQGSAVFTDANAGDDKAVIFTGFSLGGSAAGNYTLSAQPADVTASISQADSTITTKPDAKTGLTYTGEDLELVTAASGEDGGQVVYAVSDTEEAPEEGYSPDVPKAKGVGTYYVWYKVVGDENHKSTEPKCIKVNISENDKSELEDAIEDADDFFAKISDIVDYQDVAEALKDNIAAAEDILNTADVTQDEIDAATEGLKEALQAAKDAVKAIDDEKAAEAVRAKIKALKDADKITLDDKEAVEEARAAYDALTDDQKKLISDDLLNKLIEDEEALKALEDADSEEEGQDDDQDNNDNQTPADVDKDEVNPGSDEGENTTPDANKEQADPTDNTDVDPTKNDDSSKKDTYNYSNEWVDGLWYSSDGSQTYKPVGHWEQDIYGWYYIDEAGWYPTNMWQKIDGYWYFFNEEGYMCTNQYCGSWDPYLRGAWWVGADGRWDGSACAIWNMTDGTYWFGDTDGWFAHNGWLKICGYWYYFDSEGWMLSDCYIGPYYVGEDGAWQP